MCLNIAVDLLGNEKKAQLPKKPKEEKTARLEMVNVVWHTPQDPRVGCSWFASLLGGKISSCFVPVTEHPSCLSPVQTLSPP